MLIVKEIAIGCWRELQEIIAEIMVKEKKMQESLRRFGTQRDTGAGIAGGSWDDLDQLTRLKVQVWVDIQAFKSEVITLIRDLDSSSSASMADLLPDDDTMQ